MSDKQTSTQMFGHQPLTTGHFGTTVNTLDQFGHAYSPGQAATGTNKVRRGKKVDGENPEDPTQTPDPFDCDVLPLGDTPWLFIGLLLLIYLVGSPKIFNFGGKRSVKHSVIQGQSPQSR